MPITRPALNPGEAIAEKDLRPSFKFLVYLRGIREDLSLAPSGFNPVNRPSENATIPATAMPTDGNLSAGLYRLSWAAKVVTVAGVSSDFQITISWTWQGVTQQWVSTLRNGNLTTTYDLGSVPLMKVDAATPITYALAYNSNPAGAMRFDLFLTLERMAAL